MAQRFHFSSEQNYVTKTLSELYSFLQDSQPSHTYPGDWYQAVQLRNTINRMIQDYEEHAVKDTSVLAGRHLAS